MVGFIEVVGSSITSTVQKGNDITIRAYIQNTGDTAISTKLHFILDDITPLCTIQTQTLEPQEFPKEKVCIINTNTWSVGTHRVIITTESHPDIKYYTGNTTITTQPATVIIDVVVKDQDNILVVGAQVNIPDALGAKTIATNMQGIAVGFTLEKNKAYTVTATPPNGYISDSGSSEIFTADINKTISLTLTKEELKGNINCNSTPPGAQIFLDDHNTMQYTPHVFTGVAVGSHRIDYYLTDHDTCGVTVTVPAGGTAQASCTLPRQTGTLNCTSNPTGAQITIGTTNYGLTNRDITLNIGTYDVTYSRNGYEDYTKTVTISAGKTTFMSWTLVELPGSIRCQAYDSVSNAALAAVIYLDESKINFLTPHTLEATAGTHTVKFTCEGMGSCEGYEPTTVTVTVISGQTVDAYGSMVKSPEPVVPGFDINVNIPDLIPNRNLFIQHITNIPFTESWIPDPLSIPADIIEWRNISNKTYKARQNLDKCDPAPIIFQGNPLVVGDHYVIEVGDPYDYVYYYVEGINEIKQVTDETVDISITKQAMPPEWLLNTCGFFDVSEGDCLESFYKVIPDIAFSAEDLSIIIDGKSIYPPYERKTPTPWNYLWVLLTFTPIGIIKKVSKPATAIIKAAKLDPKLADLLTEMNFGKRVTFMTEDQLNLISTFAEELRYDDIRTLLSGITEKPASLADYKIWMTGLKDVIGDEKAVKNMDVGVKGAPTTIKHADALFDMAVDYSDDAGNLLEYFKTSKLDDVVDLANDIEANPGTYNKLIDGSEVIDPYNFGVSLKHLYHIDGLLYPGNVEKLEAAGKLDGFAHDLFMAMQDTPDIYRELMKHVPDSDVGRLSDELIDASHQGLASIYRGLKSVTDAESTGGLYSGLDNVGKALDAAANEGGDASKAARSVLDNAVDVIPTNAADDAVALAFEATDDAVRMPEMQRLWTWIKDTAADTGRLWSGMTLAEKARWYAKYIFTVGCFGLFIAEETIQWVGFGSIPLWSMLDRWDHKTVEQRQAIISDLKWFLDARRKMHDTIGLTLVPLTIACPFMAPLYYKFHQADSVNIEAYSRTIEYLENDINPQTGLGICRIPVKSNLNGVDVYMDGMPTGKKAYPYVQYIENVPVKETEYEIAIVGTKSGYLPDTQMITIYPTDIGKTTGDVFLELQPESIIEEVNPFPHQEPADNSTLPEPYGPVDPDIWWSGDVGDVWCTSDPPNAEVWVGTNKYPGVTPLKIESLDAGDYTLIYKREDYTDCHDNITIIAGRQIESFCELEFKCSTPVPSISVTPSEPITGELIQLEGSVANADPSKMKNWEWDIAGIRKTGQNITHTFTTEGTKSVKLTVTNECDSTFTTSRTVYVSKPDIIGFINCYCSGDYCGEGISISLDGGDTGQKTTNKPFYTVVQATAGTHTIEYNYKDIMKCGDTVTVVAGEDVSIDCSPVGVLDPDQAGVETTVTGIIDGDTIRTQYTDDIVDSPSIRLVGYDAAESGTVQGIEATELLTSYIPVGTPITLKIWQFSPLGFYGRVLGGVFKDGVDINLEMLKSCIVELSSYRDKFYWVDWDLYENQYCDNDLYGNLTVKTYSAPNEPMTGVTVYVDNLDKGNAPVTIKSLSIGSHSIRLEKAGHPGCAYCEDTGCTPGSPISECDFMVNIDAGTTKVLEVTLGEEPTCPNPTARFLMRPSSPEVNEIVTLDASESTPGSGQSMKSYGWDFGGGGSEYSHTPRTTIAYSIVDDYIINLTVENECGNKDVESKSITVSETTVEPATWEIGNATDTDGNILSAARVFVDEIYIGHYAPETLEFCPGCTCDTVVPCGFGEHTVTVRKTGYRDWSNTRTLAAGDSFTDNPVMEQVFEFDILSIPDGATITVDGATVTTSLNLIQQLLLERK